MDIVLGLGILLALQQAADPLEFLLLSGALAALQSRGVSIPGAARVVGFDDISISHMCTLPFTTIKQHIDSVGRYLADTIIGMIYGRDESNGTKIFPLSLITRPTT